MADVAARFAQIWLANSNETIFDDAAQSVLICRATAPPVIFAPGNIRNDYSVDIYFLFAEQIISFKRTDMRMSIINAAAQAENTSLKRHRFRSRGVQVSRCDAGWARSRIYEIILLIKRLNNN